LSRGLVGPRLGAAHVTRFLVEHVAPGLGPVAVRLQLGEMARYTGIEDRSNYPLV
jgi:hypothetical protein